MTSIIRPFMGLDDLELHFAQRLRRTINDRDLAEDEEASTMLADQVASCNAEISTIIHIGPMLRALSTAGLTADDVNLLSYRTSATRRLTTFSENRSLAELASIAQNGEIVVSAGRRTSQADELLEGESSGFTLGLALVLARGQDPTRTLRPFQKGTWLVEATLKIRSRQENQDGILPIPLTEERIAELQSRGIHVGPATLLFVEIGGEVLNENFRERVNMYIHRDLNEAFDRVEKGDEGIDEDAVRYEAAKLGVEVVSIIAQKCFLEISSLAGTNQLERNDILEVVTKVPSLAAFLAKPLSRLDQFSDRKDEDNATDIVLLAGTDSGRLRALLEDCNGVGGLTASALGLKA